MLKGSLGCLFFLPLMIIHKEVIYNYLNETQNQV